VNDDLFIKHKVTSAAKAVMHIKNGSTLATGGFIGIGFAESLAVALEQRFLGQGLSGVAGRPNGLTLLYAGGQGDGKDRGLNHLAHSGLLSCVIGGHWGLAPKLQKLAMEGDIEAYNLPQGVISQLFRDTAAHRPGLITQVGLGTFVDPRLGGGRINQRSMREMMTLMKIDGNEYLFFKSIPIHACLLRGTSADELGNISMEREALTLDSLAIAMATHNSGGIVIVQVERLVLSGTLHAREVKIPGILVDHVVVAEKPEDHMQTFSVVYSAVFSGEIKIPDLKQAATDLDLKKVIARRAAMELRANDVVNLGIGIPELIVDIAKEENLIEMITLTAEPGVIGGLPSKGLNFGAAINAQAILDQPYQFDFYDGGGLDIAFLGLAQTDEAGNVDVSRFNGHLAGAGGFISISQNTKRLVFVGTFCAGQIDEVIESGQINIKKDAVIRKFIKKVDQITFNGKDALKRGQFVLYVTERCVFKLTTQGLELIEIAPGMNLDQDVLSHMDFKPKISSLLKTMDSRLYKNTTMSIRADILNLIT